MSEAFKERLRRYAAGSLSEKERMETEQEIEMMETYQTYLEEQLEEEGGGVRQAAMKQLPPGKEQAIIRRGKWKARIANTLNVLASLFIFIVVASIITALFYGPGNPNRAEMYSYAASSAVALAYPNITVHLNFNVGQFFGMNLNGNLHKRIGDDFQVTAGQLSMKLLFGSGRSAEYEWLDSRNAMPALFYYPDEETIANGESFTGDRRDIAEWERLDKLPEGTVAEAYISLDRTYTTDELLALLEHRNMAPLWFAVDTGPDTREPYGGVVVRPIGFPSRVLWHQDDMIETSRLVERRGWFSRAISTTAVSPEVQPYGDGELRDANFLKTLRIVNEYKSLAKKVAPFAPWEEALEYVEANGVRLYGIVVTGPVKELLKLREEEWVYNIGVGEVRLWNWRDRTDRGY